MVNAISLCEIIFFKVLNVLKNHSRHLLVTRVMYLARFAIRVNNVFALLAERRLTLN